MSQLDLASPEVRVEMHGNQMHTDVLHNQPDEHVEGEQTYLRVAECESAPKWDPTRFRHTELIFRRKSERGWGLDRRRSGPHLEAEIASYINSLR